MFREYKMRPTNDTIFNAHDPGLSRKSDDHVSDTI